MLNSFDLPDCYRELKKKNVRCWNHGAQTQRSHARAALFLAMLATGARPTALRQASPAALYSARQVGTWWS